MTLALLLAAPGAHAQSYAAPAYTGGQLVLHGGNGTTTTQNYALSSGSYGANYYTSASAGQTASATASGTISYTATWSGGPNNLPRPSAVVKIENCTVQYTSAFGTGTDSNPLAASGATAPTPPGTSWACTRYSGIAAPPSTISSSLSGASASASVTAPAGYYATVSAGVSYSVSFAPVSINLQGATKDAAGNYSILVGQRCTASLVGIPTDCTVSRNWSVTGHPLQSWTASSSSAGPVTGLSSTTDPTTYWYWNDAATTETVTCTVTVTPPSGKGAPFPLTVIQKVNLQRPAWSAINYTGLGYITHGAVYYLQALPSPLMRNQGFAYGSTWHMTVTIPTPVSGSGQFCYAQIVTPGEYITPNGGTEVSSLITGQTGLDSQFPYLGDVYNADGSPHDEGDSPSIPLNVSGQSPDSIQYVRLTDVFKTYLMFLPSGANSQWVPLAESDWHLNMGAGKPSSGHWSDFGATQYAGGVLLDSDFANQLSYPTWSQTL